MADDPTTPLGDLVSREPTIERAPSGAPQRGAGFTPGSIVAGRYRIVSLLGRGGMGEVYRADDLRLGQPVALKFVTISDAAGGIENLYHEVRVARQVSHPNVCRVHDVVEADGLRFIAMEYVDGEDLASLLRRVGRLPAAKATQVARDMASGLAAAHDRGIVHRDLKPGNVMIDGKGRARITDFGLASLAGHGEGTISGTPAYMAPEQVTGGAVTLRSDVYALGLVLYELFTGKRVYDAPSYGERRSQRPATPRPPSTLAPEIEPGFDHLIASCLAADPEARPASAHAVLALLPGGDALDAALAAGETPSPEMVAAATETGVIPARVAYAIAGAVILALPLVAWQSQSFLYNLVRKPPEVMMERAANIVAAAGIREPARDEAMLFQDDLAMRRSRWGERLIVRGVRPGIVRFIYRRSSSGMAAQRVAETISSLFVYQTGHITLDDPPIARAGDAAVVLDQNGALVEFRARPSLSDHLSGWQPLLEATGVDLGSLRDVPPLGAPPVPSDARKAWTARYPNAGTTPVRIEAASFDGRPSWLSVAGPWHKDEAPPPAHVVFIACQMVLSVAMCIGGFYAARRNLRRGSIDRRGGVRLAFFAGALLLASWELAAHHSSSPDDEARMSSLGLGGAIGGAALLWTCYAAIEPSVRRRWPRALIGWMRLLAGRFRDPMVGRDLLIGIAASIVFFEILWLGNTLSGKPYVHASNLDPLRGFLANTLIENFDAIGIGITCIFIYLVLTLLLRRPAAAVIAWLVLFAGMGFVIPAAPFFMALNLFVLLRFGLLPAVTMNFCVGVLLDSPLTLDTTAWFWPRAATVMMAMAAAAVWSARRAVD